VCCYSGREGGANCGQAIVGIGESLGKKESLSMSVLYAGKGITFDYRLGTQTVPALAGVDLQLERGGFYCLAGPSGSGKTTLLNLLGMIENVQTGSLLLDGTDLAEIGEAEKNRIRRFRIGFIFQTFNLFPVLRAEENVEYFLHRQGVPSTERKQRVTDALNAVGLWEHRRKRPAEMSGGQRQRVAIARALAKKPDVIIGDEPTASLDQETGKGIIDTLTELSRNAGVTMILSSHDPMVLARAQHVITLRDGRIV
jgi:ABC-type lipoprotein export system ATPase subunit